MSYFEFPHTRSYEGDLGFVIKKIIELTEKYNDFFAYNSIKFADPLQWDITKQYEAFTIVFDYDSGYSYISKRPIPVGVNITNPDYWCLVGPLIIDAQARASIDLILRFIANNYDSSNIATAVRSAGDYVVANGQFYKVTQTINIGEAYTVGYNVVATTIENMINDQFPIGSDKIAGGAITISKIANGAVTSEKIAQHSIYKEKLASDKYIFIGDSFNADNHYSWGKKIAARLGLTLGTNAWVVAAPGGGMGNGLILPEVQTLANSMTSADKNTVTKIIMVFGANDWSQAEANIANGLVALENYLVSTFPNAEIMLIAAQWGFLNATYRQGLLSAYNIYASTVKKIKFIDKQFILMLDPYFVADDGVHPTDSCTSNMAFSIISIMQGGTGWTKYYTALKAQFDTTPYGGNLDNYTFFGDITPAGTHVYINDRNGIQFSNTPLTITRAGVQFAVMDCTNDPSLNNLFQLNAEIPTLAFIRTPSNTYHVIKATIIVTKRADSRIWDMTIKNDTVINGSFDIAVAGLYLGFNVYLDYTKT